MAPGAISCTRRSQLGISTMFCMTRRARELRRVACRQLRMMCRPVMTRETSRIRRTRGKSSRSPHVARLALLLEHRMCWTQPAARIHARIAHKKMPTSPHQCDSRRQHSQPQFRALERRRPLEVVQVDPLRNCLSCPGPRHLWSAAARRRFAFFSVFSVSELCALWAVVYSDAVGVAARLSVPDFELSTLNSLASPPQRHHRM